MTKDTSLKKEILFCSADKLIQKVIRKRLELEGFHVLLAGDGNEADEMISSKEIDLVVTEELLPFQSGFELIKICDSRSIPSIIISDTDLENKILEAFDLGAYDFIDKPYSPGELIVRIKSILKHRK